MDVTISAAEKEPPLPVNVDLGIPSINLRTAALEFAERMGWLSYLWPVNPDKVPPKLVSHMIFLKVEATVTARVPEEYLPEELREFFGQPRAMCGLMELGPREVLPFIFGLAVAFGVGPDAVYREDLVV
jgi:hypothetical protein